MSSPNLLTSTYCGNLRVEEEGCHMFFFSLTSFFEFNSIKNTILTLLIFFEVLNKTKCNYIDFMYTCNF